MAAEGRAGARPRIALVLGSGGIVGGAFHAGVLKALLDSWDIDARHVDLVVGTSAGAIAGALVAAGLHPNDLFRRETATALSPAGQRILGRARARRGPKPSPQTTIGGPLAPEAMLRALVDHRDVTPGGLAAALMPRGSAPTDHVAGLIDGLFGSEWPQQPELRICAIEARSAKRVVFGPGGWATPSQAVASSCAVPGVFKPVRIDGRDHIDGGAHSADNLDVVGDEPYDLVVVSSPMTTDGSLGSSMAWNSLRAIGGWQTDSQRRRLSSSTHVELVRPAQKDLDAMGNNLLDVTRRPAVAVQAHATASALFANTARPV